MENSPNDRPTLAKDSIGNRIQCLSPIGYHVQLDGSAPASVTSSEDFYEGQVVRIVAAEGAVYIAFADKTASVSDIYLPAESVEYFIIRSTTKISIYSAIVDITVMM